MASSIEIADLVVIGAGWHGLVAAKTYLEVNPDANVVVLDAGSSVGGVWAVDHIYPGLKSNNMLGTYQYSDFPMDGEAWGVKPGQHIPGHVVHEYLTKYAEKFGVLQRIRFNCVVKSVERNEEGGWLLTTNGQPRLVKARRLAIATGMTSQAFLPTFKGQDLFGVPLFHSKDFAEKRKVLETAKKVTVLGGGKSAWDAVYANASRGVEVDWVIRESGHGPCWMTPPYVTPLKIWLEKLVHTRVFTWMSPCAWGTADGYGTIRHLLHGTAIGRRIVDWFWGMVGSDVVGANNYDAHPETAKLKPWVLNAFWIGTTFSMLNYETDFFELVKSGKVRVHIADITQLSPGKVHLSSGEIFDTEAFICGTGWKRSPPVEFLPPGLEAQLGLPHALPLSSSIGVQMQQPDESLTAYVDAEILSTYPRLVNQPKWKRKSNSLDNTGAAIPDKEKLSPRNLYRFMVPTDAALLAAHDVVFLGGIMSITTATIAQAQALWMTAYFDGRIPSIPSSTMEVSASTSDPRPLNTGKLTDVAPAAAQQITPVQHSAALHNRFGKWRYLGYGGFPDFVFDAVPYIDLLLGDLGVKTRRKRGFLKEILEPYTPKDYIGIVQEWVKAQVN